MLHVSSAVSGERVASFHTDELEGQSVKSVKIHLAKQIGVSRFRQRCFSGSVGHELHDDARLDDDELQLVVLAFKPPEDEQDQRLISACVWNRWEEVEVLLQQPLAPDTTDAFGRTALHAAASNGHWRCLSLLLEAKAAQDKEQPQGLTALYLAAQNGHLEVVRVLLKAGADKEKVMPKGMTALHAAALNGHAEVAMLLLQGTATQAVSQREATDFGSTALHVAAMEGHPEVVQLLLEAGFQDVAREGRTALHWASGRGHLEVVRLLLEAKAQKDHVDLRDGVDCFGCVTSEGPLGSRAALAAGWRKKGSEFDPANGDPVSGNHVGKGSAM